ncbi:hypothetical protein EDC39_11063 [Geothermobacter ehrlichii]|uniref:Calcineurin-like phosphoesterase domain-containing protein n=1 Tax=Geothermobacter ehrlichii TaxID=213224 RepID=A0A5D3WIC5_9BACT|nr:metallophosphoesterase [Geothermobacter ehrlichii]TYO97523.1 hypothetical protein EDC39_11063 [Geothermobacter ehrlichii]
MKARNETTAPHDKKRRRFLRNGLLALGGLISVDGLVLEPNLLTVETLILESERLPSGAKLRLVQLADLHIGRLGDFHRHVVDRIASLRPDLILHTGDYLEERRNIREVLQFLARLQGIAESYAVQGNWEYWSRLEGDNLRRKFAARGVRLLIDEAADFLKGGIRLRILGLDYPSTADSLRRLADRADRRAFNLLLSHVPAFEHRLLGPDIGLILSGHTHGGQIRVPLLPPLYLPRYSGRFIAGHYRVGLHDTPLYVSRGLGASVLPLRINCRPELTLIELRGTAPSQSTA